MEALAQAPMVHTMHIVPDDDHARLWTMRPNACVTAISQHQWSDYPQLHPAAAIPHGVDAAQFTLRVEPEDSGELGLKHLRREEARRIREQEARRAACRIRS